ncbi:hypothetical protein CLU88_1627 [Acidovorax sp. 56]|nr:hypothetical protein CLU88_1627 [Acidovorax sp. 56]
MAFVLWVFSVFLGPLWRLTGRAKVRVLSQ